MCSVSVPLLRHVACLWLQTFQHKEDRVVACVCRSPAPEELWAQHFPQQRYDRWHPACCLQQLLSPLLYDYSFPHNHREGNASNLCCKSWWLMQGQAASVPQEEVNRAEFSTVDPREGLQEHLPASSCSCVSRAVRDPARLREEADGKGEPSHWVLSRAVIGVHHVTGTASSDPLERTVQRNIKSNFIESERISGNL